VLCMVPCSSQALWVTALMAQLLLRRWQRSEGRAGERTFEQKVAEMRRDCEARAELRLQTQARFPDFTLLDAPLAARLLHPSWLTVSLCAHLSGLASRQGVDNSSLTSYVHSCRLSVFARSRSARRSRPRRRGGGRRSSVSARSSSVSTASALRGCVLRHARGILALLAVLLHARTSLSLTCMLQNYCQKLIRNMLLLLLQTIDFNMRQILHGLRHAQESALEELAREQRADIERSAHGHRQRLLAEDERLRALHAVRSPPPFCTSHVAVLPSCLDEWPESAAGCAVLPKLECKCTLHGFVLCGRHRCASAAMAPRARSLDWRAGARAQRARAHSRRR
jgi:hypothetical protein